MNTYFSPRRKNIPHVTPNYGPRKSKLEIDYYRHTYDFPEKLSHIQGMLKTRSISNDLFKIFQLPLYGVCWL